MKIDGRAMRTIWLARDGWSVEVIDQTKLPHAVEIARWTTVADAAQGIKTMVVRGAPLIGGAAAYGLCLALRADASDAAMQSAIEYLARQRPTAVNLRWALERMREALAPLAPAERAQTAYREAALLCEGEVEACRMMGVYGARLIRDIAARKGGKPVNILTHCNAGWLACIDWGTATAPIYHAHDAGVPLHVWVDETRPRNQGASLTAWELGAHGVPRTLIADNAGGHLMQRGEVDMVLVGTDRVTANGDVANKIGTYLKALAARDCGIPFYVALPQSTIDWEMPDGSAIEIEERAAEEVLHISGRAPDGRIVSVEIAGPGTPAANPAFDVTPARLVTGLITEKGICAASAAGLRTLYGRDAGGA